METNNKTQAELAAADRQIELITKALEGATEDGHWLNGLGKFKPKVYPKGAELSPFNALIFALHSDANGYRTNLYISFASARSNNLAILKGERSVPMLWYNWSKMVNRSDDKDIITREDWQNLPEAEQAKYKNLRQREVRSLFNIEQTTLPLADAEEYDRLKADFGGISDRGYIAKEEKDVHVAVNRFIDSVRDNLVPIRKATDGEARYDMEKDAVYMPAQKSYADYHDYVQDLVRNVVAATGHADRLSPSGVVNQGSNRCTNAYEALVREVASGYKMLQLGLPAKISPETRKMLPTLVAELRSNPRLVDALESDVNNIVNVLNTAENGIKVVFSSQMKPLRLEENTQVSHEEALIIQDILRHGGMRIDARNFPGATDEERAAAKKDFMEKFCNLDYYEGQLNLSLWQAQENQSDPELINVAYTAAGNEAERIHRVMSEYLPKDWEQKGSHFIADEMAGIPDARSREFVVVRNPETGIADVVLPACAQTGGNVKMPNGELRSFWLTPDEVMLPDERKETGAKVLRHNLTGMNKEKIEAALMARGASYVRFFNKEGELRYRPDDAYFKGKEVFSARMEGNSLSVSARFDVEEAVRNATEKRFNRICMAKDDSGKWALLLKPEGEDSFAVYPDREDQNRYFAIVKNGSQIDSIKIRNELAQKYYSMAAANPSLKFDLFGRIPEGVDASKIERVCLFRAKDEKIMCSMQMSGGKRIPPREITNAQWQRLWYADDVSRYKTTLAAMLFADVLRENKAEVGEVVSCPADAGCQLSDHPDGNLTTDNRQLDNSEFKPDFDQYEKLREKHTDAVLLFRVGDTYHAYQEDAPKLKDILGAKVQDVVSTDGREMKMATFPHEELESQLPKLVRSGHRVAICEEVVSCRAKASCQLSDHPDGNLTTDNRQLDNSQRRMRI